MSNVLKLAITGTIGSGKSVVSRVFGILGVPVYDCDSKAKMLMVKDKTIVKSLKRMFGEECYDENGQLNRSYLASRIFIDKENVRRVNALVHPVVKKDFERWALEQNCDVVGVETAILYESGVIDSVDKVLVVWADRETAIRRTIERSGMSRSQVESRMNNQMSSDELLLLSDYSIYNDGDEPVLPEVILLLEQLKSISNFAVSD
ncbi:MAG: dephospho-CoA kinase [Bacteroidaceae bacterium]|nr:dephospho-CoA kinase [Bacteroidaceae bacterium]